MRVPRRLTEAEFAAVRPLLKISEERINAAHAAMVEGKSMSAISKEAGWCRQAVSKVVGIVWKTFERYQESQREAAKAGTLLPPGWEQVTLIAPSPLIEKFRREIAESLAPARKPGKEKNKAQREPK